MSVVRSALSNNEKSDLAKNPPALAMVESVVASITKTINVTPSNEMDSLHPWHFEVTEKMVIFVVFGHSWLLVGAQRLPEGDNPAGAFRASLVPRSEVGEVEVSGSHLVLRTRNKSSHALPAGVFAQDVLPKAHYAAGRRNQFSW